MLLRHGSLAIHAILRVAVYVNATQDKDFRIPLHPFNVETDVGTVTGGYYRTFLQSFDAEMLAYPDHTDNGALPIHVACAQGVPSEILSILVEMDPATLQISDSTGALPLHTACDRGGRVNLDSLRFLVDRGGPTPLSARDQDGALPLHHLLRALPRRALLPSTPLAGDEPNQCAELTAVEHLLNAHGGSVSVATNEDELPFVVAAKTGVSVDILYTLLRANPAALSTSTRREQRIAGQVANAADSGFFIGDVHNIED